jgi:outer membrane protein assembly factor BamB
LYPGGSIKWTRVGLVAQLASTTSIDFLADGTIVTGTDSSVVALNQDGTTKWTFTFDISETNTHIEVGPSVGPDGNIYAVTGIGGSADGLGAFSLTPDGDLRWNDPGNPALAPINSSTGGPVFFTQERMIFPFRIVGSGANLVYGFDFDGNQTLYVDFTCTGIPRTDPLNRLLIASACGIEAIEQDGNESYWTVQFGAVNLAPAIGADATSYAAQWFGDVNAINPDGSIQWTSGTATDAFRFLAVRQDVGRLVYSGAVNFGMPDFVSGVDTEDGMLLWTVNLATINTHNEGVWTHQAPTSADGSVVYFTTRFTSNGEPGALYAVQITPQGTASGITRDQPGRLQFDHCYPNPFNPTTTLGYSIPQSGIVHLVVYDASGRRVKTLANGFRNAGPQQAFWDGRDDTGRMVSSGVYFARLHALGAVRTRKMVVSK